MYQQHFLSTREDCSCSFPRGLHWCLTSGAKNTWKIAKAWNQSQVLLWCMDLVELLRSSLHDQPYGWMFSTKISVTQHQKPNELLKKSTEHTLYLNLLNDSLQIKQYIWFLSIPYLIFFWSNNRTQGKLVMGKIWISASPSQSCSQDHSAR